MIVLEKHSYLLVVCLMVASASAQGPAQNEASPWNVPGGRRIVIETEDAPAEPPVFYRSRSRATVRVGVDGIDQEIAAEVHVVQGQAETIVFGLNGPGKIQQVTGEQITSWSVRQVDTQRFLDLQVQPGTEKLEANIRVRQDLSQVPVETELTHLGAGSAIGFDSLIHIQYATDVAGNLLAAEGFVPLQAADDEDHLQSATGGKLVLRVLRRGSALGAVELTSSRLAGSLLEQGQSVGFQLSGTAVVTKVGARLPILSGKAAVSQVPDLPQARLQLSQVDGVPQYELVFTQTGTFPIELDIVAPVQAANTGWQSLDFTIAASAVVPIMLSGLDQDLEFRTAQDSVVPSRDGDQWVGFLPASGRFQLAWKDAREVAEGKLFFTTSALIDTMVGPGLLRQSHQLDYQVLQGELSSLRLQLLGPGEILNVSGEGIVAWQVEEQEGEGRQLTVTLSQPIRSQSRLEISSQTPLGAFPIRMEALRIQPLDAIRHAGQIRIRNVGSVRLEPTDLVGLTQLAPEQYAGEPVEARQTFVYRFPAANHEYALVADRVQPEVNISELLVYRLAEADRLLQADIELDIREAGIREWDFQIPEDYSIVSVTGAALSDYVASSESEAGRRNLKVLFNAEVQGRQLVSLQLEKNVAASSGTWNLPRILHPQAKTLRGEIGVVGAPGFRIAIESTDLLVEKPLSYFSKQVPNLQQAFRVREPGWSATLRVEQLERSVQSDVFHLYSLSRGAVYGSALINYFVTGAPTAEWRLRCPPSLRNVTVDGQDIRSWRREDDTLVVTLHQPVMGAYTLLVTFEEQPDEANSTFQAGLVEPQEVQSERGYIQVVSPLQVEVDALTVSSELLVLDALELPGEFRLLSTARALGTWQYTERPFELTLNVTWFQPGTTATQVVEFSEANSHVSTDGELVTAMMYYVKSRGEQVLRIKLPPEPVRLWAVTVAGQPVTARQADEETLIPLPGNADPNVPVEVTLHFARPATEAEASVLELPVVLAPVLKTQWHVSGDENHVLIAQGDQMEPTRRVVRPTGFEWLARRSPLSAAALGVLTLLAVAITRRGSVLRCVSVLVLLAVVLIAGRLAWDGWQQIEPPADLQLSLPVLAAGETVSLAVQSLEIWRVRIDWPGVALLAVGLLCLIAAWIQRGAQVGPALLVLGFAAAGIGILMQGDGGPAFFLLVAVIVLFGLLLPLLRQLAASFAAWQRMRASSHGQEANQPKSETGAVTTTLLMALIGWQALASNVAMGEDDPQFRAASELSQDWQVTHATSRLSAKGAITLEGRPGDQFRLLSAPAVLTQFEGPGLRLTKTRGSAERVIYVVTIPFSEEENQDDAADESEVDGSGENNGAAALQRFTATFEYQLEAVDASAGIPILTGAAAVQELELTFDQPGWKFRCDTAARLQPIEDAQRTRAKLLLGPGSGQILIEPAARDVTREATQFFVEGNHLYIPAPGVVDGVHRVEVRTSQGRVRELDLVVPAGLAVSEVQGPVASWQFNAESRHLELEIDPSASSNFVVNIQTQRGFDPLPANVQLAPLRVENCDGEVGLIALAFGADAQPESVDAEGMSLVNLGDFDGQLLAQRSAVLHRVYRYGQDAGSLTARVTPVAAEVRAVARQVLSFGDERIVLAANFAVEITRAGLFQLSFVLPEGLEVESLTGDAPHHWAELSEQGQRRIMLHLNGKTLGTHNFALTLSGSTPVDVTSWTVPRFTIREATRQTGDLVVRPSTGIRLRTTNRQNVSEVDPRSLGGGGQGALAFRLLQSDWELVLGIEKLDPWVSGQVLHDVVVREGQTRTTLLADFNIQNASIRSLRVALPITDEEELNTLRANGSSVSDFVRTAPDSDVWEIQFKRRLIGPTQFQIEYEHRGDRAEASQELSAVTFPEASQVTYFMSVRAGGRLEINAAPLPPEWQRVDWNTVPQSLRLAGDRNVPALALQALAPNAALRLEAERHALADALKLRVAKGTLTTVLSPTGDQLTAVDVTLDVIQRGSLQVRLPAGGDLFSIFVNGESVHSVRRSEDQDLWQFTVLPGMDDRTAQVRFVYSLKGKGLRQLSLASPQLDAPLENIQWNVIAPLGFELVDHDGNLELVGEDQRASYDRDSYLSKASSRRQDQAQQATELLAQANSLLQSGQQTKARWALNSVANQYALDAASNEDARVQLENLQTQQAIVGLNTRRQRLYLDNNRGGEQSAGLNQQLQQAAAANPILQQGELNFRPQELSQLLAGNTSDDNAVLQQIAGRLVQHQRTTEPAPQAILISMPEEGTVYRFSRGVQVAEDTALQLDLEFGSVRQLHPWQWALAAAVLAILTISLAWFVASRPAPAVDA